MSPPTPLHLVLWLNLVIAASAGGWVVVTSRLLGLRVDPVLVGLAVALAGAFYTRDRLDEGGLATDGVTMPARTAWVRGHRRALRWWAGVWAMAAAGLLAVRPAAGLPIATGLGFALSYTVRWLPWRGQRVGWKHLPGMKAPFVAVLWTLLTVGVPIAVHGPVDGAATGRVAGSVAALVMVQILLNDLRDVAGDRMGGTASLPVLLGDRRARLVGTVLALGAALLALPLSPRALPLVALYSVALLWGYRREADAQWRGWIEAQGAVAALLVGITS